VAMPRPVVPIRLNAPVGPVLRSTMNLAVPRELSTQFSVNLASRVLPEAARVAASTTTPTLVQPARWTTARNNAWGRSTTGLGSDGASVVNVQVGRLVGRLPE